MESENDNEASELSVNTDEASVFTKQELEILWLGFIDSNLSNNPGFGSLLRNYLPDIGADFELIINFETQLQVDMFKEFKHELLGYLKKKLDNNLITITESIIKQESHVNKLYTDEDKFRFLSQKNPAIIKLKQQLNLDFE